MTAWTRLLAASSLAIGTAWDLITHPRTGGTGVIVNTGATALIQDTAMAMTLADSTVSVALANPAVVVTVLDAGYQILLADRAAVAALD